jgi:hypothetical protein
LLIVVAIGVVVLAVSGPKKGSVEWHVRKCRDAHYHLTEASPWRIRAYDLWNMLRGRDKGLYFEDQYEEREKQQRALIRLGYLEEHEFVLSNRSVDVVLGSHHPIGPPWVCTSPEFLSVRRRGTNTLIIGGTRQDMQLVTEAIRRVDAP